MRTEIPSLHALQVSFCLDTLSIYFNDITEVERAYPGSFRVILTTLAGGGVKTEKITIAPERGARFTRPLEHLFWYVFGWDLCPFHATAPTFAASALVDVLPPIFSPHTWYVYSGLLVRY